MNRRRALWVLASFAYDYSCYCIRNEMDEMRWNGWNDLNREAGAGWESKEVHGFSRVECGKEVRWMIGYFRSSSKKPNQTNEATLPPKRTSLISKTINILQRERERGSDSILMGGLISATSFLLDRIRDLTCKGWIERIRYQYYNIWINGVK